MRRRHRNCHIVHTISPKKTKVAKAHLATRSRGSRLGCCGLYHGRGEERERERRRRRRRRVVWYEPVALLGKHVRHIRRLHFPRDLFSNVEQASRRQFATRHKVRSIQHHPLVVVSARVVPLEEVHPIAAVQPEPRCDGSALP